MHARTRARTRARTHTRTRTRAHTTHHAAPHPLDALSPAEVEAAAGLARKEAKLRIPSAPLDRLRFAYVSLQVRGWG